MRTELFKSKVFFYILLIIIGVDVFNGFVQISKISEILGINVSNWLKLIISFVALLMFFLKTNFNHQLFKLYIWFMAILAPLFIILYNLKELVFYGINPIAPEKLLENGLTLSFGLILLFFYNRFKVEYQQAKI